MRSIYDCLAVLLTILITGCTTYQNHPTPDEMSVHAVAKTLYREHLWYDVYTRPDIFFKQTAHEERGQAVRILAVGDSWFAYPKNFVFMDFLFSDPSNILTNMSTISRHSTRNESPEYRILSLSNSGELIANIAGRAEQDPVELIESVQTEVNIPWVIVRSLRQACAFRKHSNGGRCTDKPFDYVMLSGGGNDLLSNKSVRSILKPGLCRIQTDLVNDCIDKDKLEERIKHVLASYRTIYSLITSQPGYEKIKLVAHTYDRFSPMPVGAEFLAGLINVGTHGWLYAHLDTHDIRDPEQQQKFVDHVLGRFSEELQKFSEETRRQLIVVNTQGTLKELAAVMNLTESGDVAWRSSDAVETSKTQSSTTARSNHQPRSLWLNEIHPTPSGYACIALKIHDAILADLEASGSPQYRRASNALTKQCRCPLRATPASESLGDGSRIHFYCRDS